MADSETIAKVAPAIPWMVPAAWTGGAYLYDKFTQPKAQKVHTRAVAAKRAGAEGNNLPQPGVDPNFMGPLTAQQQQNVGMAPSPNRQPVPREPANPPQQGTLAGAMGASVGRPLFGQAVGAGMRGASRLGAGLGQAAQQAGQNFGRGFVNPTPGSSLFGKSRIGNWRYPSTPEEYKPDWPSTKWERKDDPNAPESVHEFSDSHNDFNRVALEYMLTQMNQENDPLTDEQKTPFGKSSPMELAFSILKNDPPMSFGGDPDGKLAQALAAARNKPPEPPLNIQSLPPRPEYTVPDHELQYMHPSVPGTMSRQEAEEQFGTTEGLEVNPFQLSHDEIRRRIAERESGDVN